MMAGKQVLGFPAEYSPIPVGNGTGAFVRGSITELPLDRMVYRDRDSAETDEGFLQLIPYVVVRHGAEIYRYRRGTAGDEARLHGAWSVGFGGHIDLDPEAADSVRAIHRAVSRELEEEIIWGPGVRAPAYCVGFVRCWETVVDRVHFGVVFDCPIHSKDIGPREECIADPGWVTVQGILDDIGSYEKWSQFVAYRYDAMGDLLGRV